MEKFLKLDIQTFAIEGSGKAPRKSAILVMNVGTKEKPEWEKLGKDNDDLTRTRNNNVEGKTNVLGETTVEVTNGPQVTTVDPFAFKRESKIAQILYEIDKYDKELDDVVYEFAEIFEEDKLGENEFASFKQDAAIDLKSWGGPTNGLFTPFDINWTGNKTHGKFNPVTKTFSELTPETPTV